MERGKFEDFKKAHSIIVRDLLVKYQKEITPRKKGYREETHKLNFLIRHPVSKLSLMRMKSSDIYSLINELKDKNRKPQTVKHYVQLLHVVWNTAKKVWGIPLPSQSPFALVSLDKVDKWSYPKNVLNGSGKIIERLNKFSVIICSSFYSCSVF